MNYVPLFVLAEITLYAVMLLGAYVPAPGVMYCPPPVSLKRACIDAGYALLFLNIAVLVIGFGVFLWVKAIQFAQVQV